MLNPNILIWNDHSLEEYFIILLNKIQKYLLMEMIHARLMDLNVIIATIIQKKTNI